MPVRTPVKSKLPFKSQHTECVAARLGKVTHTEFAKNNVEFKTRCETAGTSPSKRQASKFRDKRGLAYNS